MPRFIKVGDTALLIEFCSETRDAATAQVNACFELLRQAKLTQIIDFVPADTTLLLVYDADMTSGRELEAQVKQLISDLPTASAHAEPSEYSKASEADQNTEHTQPALNTEPHQGGDSAGIIVEKPGTQSLIVDEGRFGYRHKGIPSASAADLAAFRLANSLVANPADKPGAAALEVTMMGPTLTFQKSTLIGLAGTEFVARLDGIYIPRNKALLAPKGSTLTMHKANLGCRGYLAVAGGFDVPLVMGSRTTDMPAGIGGYHGRALEAGDILPTREDAITYIPSSNDPINLSHTYVPPSEQFMVDTGAPIMAFDTPVAIPVRVIMGPQDDRFTPEGIETFLSTGYEVGAQSNREAYHLKGECVQTTQGAAIVPEGTVPGNIQISEEGQPLIVMQDGPTLGGLAKIATVIEQDLPLIAQAKPLDTLHFTRIFI
ncbi:MAG: biotin-dependent carboxyltransferase family protein [Coriobacteriia bacterium]|nr:biotin-dependent carboxyltransferase family protein [Coriobacteriia bacterium]